VLVVVEDRDEEDVLVDVWLLVVFLLEGLVLEVMVLEVMVLEVLVFKVVVLEVFVLEIDLLDDLVLELEEQVTCLAERVTVLHAGMLPASPSWFSLAHSASVTMPELEDDFVEWDAGLNVSVAARVLGTSRRLFALTVSE
jgi:hypothetical protein